MADRKQAAQVTYPFVSSLDPTYVEGILDCLLYFYPTAAGDTPAGTPPAEAHPVGAWVYRREELPTIFRYTVYVATPADEPLIDTESTLTDGNPLYLVKTFEVPKGPLGTIVTVKANEDDRSVMIVNTSQIKSADPDYIFNKSIIEPACVVPCVRRLQSIGLYNEYRAVDPLDRSALPPDTLAIAVGAGGNLTLKDGYNCFVSYDQNSGTLRFSGGSGYGLGQPESIPWDDTAEDFEEGIRGINGLNSLGIVNIEAGRSVYINAPEAGEFNIVVRDQGDS